MKSSTATTSFRYHLENSHPTLVDTSVVVAETNSTFESERAEQLLTKFIISNYLTFRLVDSESFQAFVNYLQPKWKVCDRKKLSMVLTPALRAEIELQMKKRMSNIDHFLISLDSWTSLANRAYLALTAHGISKNFEFESFLLDITVVKKSETGSTSPSLEMPEDAPLSQGALLSQEIVGEGGSSLSTRNDLHFLVRIWQRRQSHFERNHQMNWKYTTI